MEKSVLCRLNAAAEKYSTKTAFKDPENSLTFGEFNGLTKSIGTYLAGITQPGDPVVVMSGRHVFTPACFLGAVRAGCFYAPMDGDMPVTRLNQILSVIKSDIMLVDKAHLEIAQSLNFDGKMVVMEDIMSTPADEELLKSREEGIVCTSPLYVIFTSGSTGVPKGVITSHQSLMTYIDMDQDDLQDTIARLIAGESVVIDTGTFQNDTETFTCRDDVLTLLTHLGYLTYEEKPDSYDDETVAGLVRIPNEEVRSEFDKILRRSKHKSLIELVKKSDQLLKDTLEGKNDAVAKAIAEVHDSEYAPTYYSNEQSLRYVVKMAYLSCVDQYAKLEELPSGHGIADIVFLPKRRSTLPAMIVEMKWNKEAEGAIKQIKDRNYPKILTNYGGRIVLVGINYHEDTKSHECLIEEYRKADLDTAGR